MRNIWLFSLCILGASMSFAQIEDGGFEAGAGAGIWTEASTNFGTPLCDYNSCGDCGGPCEAYSGAFYAWFGGSGSVETGSVEQEVIFPVANTASIDMMVKIAGPGAGIQEDRLEVSIDGNVLGTINSHDSVAYEDYALFSVNVTQFADDFPHTVRIEGFQTTDTVFNILVDDVELMIDSLPTSSLFEEFTEPNFTIYPNPANDIVNLTFGELTGDAVVRLRSVKGELISEQSFDKVYGKKFVLNTENLENGVYLVEVSNNDQVTTERLVIRK